MIYHIIQKVAWETAVAAGSYQPASLHNEGFIHCSTRDQILFPANELYRGQTDLMLLCIDTNRVTAPVVYEDCYETGMEFPHIYGPLNLDAVVQVVDFPPNDDGTFTLPDSLPFDMAN
ncbi:MAG: DUF952 domain-containing protein [Chloroflexi bacterium]|nr:MAG: DUF952 domain-containing protein [Chloroflexota bacterium]